MHLEVEAKDILLEPVSPAKLLYNVKRLRVSLEDMRSRAGAFNIVSAHILRYMFRGCGIDDKTTINEA